VLEGDFIKKVVEKPGTGNEPSEFVRIVFDYFYKAKSLRVEMEKASSSRDDVYERALSNMMSSDQKFRMLRYEGNWKTIKFPWHILGAMEYFLNTIEGQQIATDAVIAETAKVNGNVIIESGVKIFDNAVINGPVYIGKNCIIGNNALVRHYTAIGPGAVVGYGVELKNCVVFSRSMIGRLSFIGDSVVGENVDIGSGTMTINVDLQERTIQVPVGGRAMDTGLRKLWAFIGDGARIGASNTLAAGSIIAPGAIVPHHFSYGSDR